MLITVCDVPEERRSDVERAGGKAARIWAGLLDAQFDFHTILSDDENNIKISPIDGGASFRLSPDGYSRIYIQ